MIMPASVSTTCVIMTMPVLVVMVYMTVFVLMSMDMRRLFVVMRVGVAVFQVMTAVAGNRTLYPGFVTFPHDQP